MFAIVHSRRIARVNGHCRNLKNIGELLKSQIGKRSDVYLLGASLFEICVGKPPHPGSTINKCMAAAMKNQVHPFDKEDQLVKIALRAMASDPDHRYKSVEELQSKIDEYKSYALSFELSSEAAETLVKAKETKNYDTFAQALFEYREALKQWPENKIAEEGEKETRMAYAQVALEKQNFELGLSQLDKKVELEKPLYEKLRKGAVERDNRAARINTLWRGGAALALFALIGISSFAGWAFVEIVVLWLAILTTTVAFFRCSKVAGWLLLPYFAWVSFASVLNFTIWRMNMG